MILTLIIVENFEITVKDRKKIQSMFIISISRSLTIKVKIK